MYSNPTYRSTLHYKRIKSIYWLRVCHNNSIYILKSAFLDQLYFTTSSLFSRRAKNNYLQNTVIVKKNKLSEAQIKKG